MGTERMATGSSPRFESLNTDFQIVVGFYDPEFLLVHNKNNNANFNGVVKIRANLYKASSISPGTK